MIQLCKKYVALDAVFKTVTIIFVYQGVTFHTFQNQPFFPVRTEKRAEK